LPWEEDNEYIRSGHRSPDAFLSDTFRTITLSSEEGIKAVIAKPKGKHTMDVVSYLFEKSKGWTVEKAKEWFAQHQRREKESFQWFGEIKQTTESHNLIQGKALHPIRTVHPEEWPEMREYLEEELSKSAHTLVGKPLFLDHHRLLQGKVLSAQYGDGAIEYVAKLADREILDKIRQGEIRHCSVEFEWGSLERVNGFSPRNITFTGLSLLENFEPGDPFTTVEVWEALIAKLKEAKQTSAEPNEFIFYLVQDPALFLEERFSTVWVDQTNGVQGLYGYLRERPDSPTPMALLFMKPNGWTLEKVQSWLRDHQQYVRQSQPQHDSSFRPLLVEAILPYENQNLLSPSGFVNKKEILDLLPERVPIHWGYGPAELIRRLKSKLE